MNDESPVDDPTDPAFYSGARAFVWLVFGGTASALAFLATAGVGLPWLGAVALPPFAVVMVYEVTRALRRRKTSHPFAQSDLDARADASDSSDDNPRQDSS